MIRYYKGDPSEHVIEFVRGRKIREGRGASFLYRPSRTSIVSVPLNTADADFVVSEVTADFQMVAIQGQITFRISDPPKAATLLNFEIDPRSKAYRSKDPPKIQARLANLVQEAALVQKSSGYHLRMLSGKGRSCPRLWSRSSARARTWKPWESPSSKSSSR
jgi:hypothetical protein